MRTKPDRLAEARRFLAIARQTQSNRTRSATCHELVGCLFTGSAERFDPPLDDLETMRLEERYEWPYLEYLRIMDEAARNEKMVDADSFLKSEYFVVLNVYLRSKGAFDLIEHHNQDLSKIDFSMIEKL